MTWTSAFAIAAVLLFSTTVSAQQPSAAGAPRDLAEAIAEAEKSNPELIALRGTRAPRVLVAERKAEMFRPQVAVTAASSDAGPMLAQLQDGLHTFEQRRYEGPPLTLDAALDEALEKNPTLMALRSQFEAARHRPAQERFLMPPSFDAQIWQWPINTLNPLNTNMYMFTFGQDIPGFGKRRLRASVVEKDVALSQNQIAVWAREVVDQVKRTYAELYLSRTAIDIDLASVDLLRQFADISEAKYVTGRISQQDVLKAVVEISRLHEDLVMRDERAQLAEAQLNTLLDRPPAARIGPLGIPRERVLVPGADELQRLALENQPELQTARLEIERAEAALAVVAREYKPDFFVKGGYMLMPRQADAWTLMAGLTWPTAPWSRGRIDVQKAEATAEIEAARAGQRAVENALRLTVQQAYVRVKSAEQRAALLRTSIVPQSNQTLEVSRIAYQTDRVDFLALIDNQRVLLDAQLGYYRALSDLEQALADLERAVGTDLGPAVVAAAGAKND